MGAWDVYRDKHLRKYRTAIAQGAVDPPIVPLLEVINRHPDYVTTSSCSGRVALIATSESERKGETFFYRKWHRPVLFEELVDAIRSFGGSGRLILKMDPFILHVGARDVPAALRLIRAARSAGVKIAGIQSVDSAKAHVEIRGIDSVALPVYDGGLLVGEDYVMYMSRYLNWKMLRNQERLEAFYTAVSTML